MAAFLSRCQIMHLRSVAGVGLLFLLWACRWHIFKAVSERWMDIPSGGLFRPLSPFQSSLPVLTINLSSRGGVVSTNLDKPRNELM